MKTHPELTFRTGKRVRLRVLHEDDLPQITQWINNPEVTQYLSQSFPQTLESEIDWLKARNASSRDYVFGIELIETEALIGVMGIHNIDYVHRTATTGSYIGDENHRNHGYGTEAKHLLLDYAFNTLNLRKICSGCIAFNTRSQRYQEKCGAKVEGVRKDQYFKNGRYWDEIILATWSEDWEKAWDTYQKTYM